jgi:flagellar biosynthesis/type III secretory pathway chaperone
MHLDRLKTVLDKELALHAHLLETAQALNEALKKRAVDEVHKVSLHYDETTMQIERLEEQRLLLSDALAKHYGESGHVNLRTLIALMPADKRPEFEELQRNMKLKIGELTRINTSNKILLEASLSTIARTVEMMTLTENKLAGYKSLGQKDTKPIQRALFNQIA